MPYFPKGRKSTMLPLEVQPRVELLTQKILKQGGRLDLGHVTTKAELTFFEHVVLLFY